MPHVDQLLEPLPDYFKDLRLNLSSVLQGHVLAPEATYAVAVASAAFLGKGELLAALAADATEGAILSPEALADAQAAAALMGMTSVYYRTKHLLNLPAYNDRKAGLRMGYMGRPRSGRELFEQCALACAALAGCEACLKAHEATLTQAGVSQDHIHEIFRIASVVSGVGVAIDTARTLAPSSPI